MFNVTTLKEKIFAYCDFTQDVCYVLNIITRTKDGNKKGSSHRMVIASVVDVEYLENNLPSMCFDEDTIFRFYISVNARNILKSKQNFAKDIMSKLFDGHVGTAKMGNAWSAELEKPRNAETKKWLIDFDSKNEVSFVSLMEYLATVTEVHYSNKTPNGFHIVCNGFNPELLEAWKTENDFSDVEVKKDALVFLWWPSNSNLKMRMTNAR